MFVALLINLQIFVVTFGLKTNLQIELPDDVSIAAGRLRNLIFQYLRLSPVLVCVLVCLFVCFFVSLSWMFPCSFGEDVVMDCRQLRGELDARKHCGLHPAILCGCVGESWGELDELFWCKQIKQTNKQETK